MGMPTRAMECARRAVAPSQRAGRAERRRSFRARKTTAPALRAIPKRRRRCALPAHSKVSSAVEAVPGLNALIFLGVSFRAWPG